MAFINLRKRTFKFEPASYTTTATSAAFNVSAGDVIVAAFVRINTAFDGTNSDTALELGDGGDPNRFIESGDPTESTAGLYQGSGVGLADDFGYIYTADDTIDVVFTRDTGADGTEGTATFTIIVAELAPI